MDDVAIRVEGINKTFKLPYEKSSSVKSALINFARHKKGYELQHALKDISFEVKKGEFFGIVGRNGSGKSTLLKLLAGIYTPDSGNIQINGKLTPFIELGVGFSPELTGRENIFLNGALLGFGHKEMEAMYKSIVEFAELERFMDQKLKNYSSGMQVRLAFSIAIRANTEILVLDEVLAVGDAAFQQKCNDYFEKLKKDKKTIILVTHDMESVEKYCDRAMLIKDGEIIDGGNPKEIAAKYRLLNLPKHENKKNSSFNLFGEVTIDKVSINGGVDAVVRETQTLRVDIVYTPKITKHFIVAISIFSSDGAHIAYYDSGEDYKEVVSNKGVPCTATCNFTANQFLEGAYTLNVDLYDEDGIYQANKTDVVRFSVQETGPSKAGLLNLQGNWKIKKS